MTLKPYLKYTWALIWRQRRIFFFCFILIILDVAARLIQPYLYKVIVDTLNVGSFDKNFLAEKTSFLISIVIFWFFLAVSNNILNAYRNFLVWEMGNRNSQMVHLEGFRKILQLDYQHHIKKSSARYSKIVDEADTSMWEMTNWWLNRFIPALIGFIGMLILALSVSWQMTLISLSVIPPGLVMVFFMLGRYEDEQHRVNKLWNKKHEHLSDQIANIITYKLNQNEKIFVDVQKGFSDRASQAQRSLNKKWRLVEMLNPDVIARFLVMGFGVFLVKDGFITLGTLFMFMGLLNEILVPLHLLGDILPNYSRKARYIDRLIALLHEKIQITDPEEPQRIDHVKGALEFRNVSFLYPSENGKPGFAIKNLSFTIDPGKHLAIVGHSGAGKSTVMALMTRLIDPTEGQILLDEIDIRHFNQEDHHSIVGVILQEHNLYNETVAQNIAYGKKMATREEIIEAAKKAAAHDFIMKLPQGYDTVIGERGVRLSGGEKQRINIARGILKNPQVVIFDEPTSALDSITEAKVQKGLKVLMEGKTAVTIAHRLSTVREADHILVMENGQMVDIGSHQELMKRCPDYSNMVQLQTSGFLDDHKSFSSL